MISNTFRDLDSLPITGQASERDAFRASVINYFAGGTVFVLSMIAFYFLGSLQVVTTEISTKPIDGASCNMLSAITLTRDIGATFYSAMTGNNIINGCGTNKQPTSSSPFCQCVFGTLGVSTWLSIRYESVFFATYDECLSSITYNCAHEYHNSNFLNGFSVSCNFTDDGTISYTTTDLNTGSLVIFPTSISGVQPQAGSGSSACSKPLPTTQELSSAVRAGLPPSYICAPYQTNQPYICSVSSRLSPLQMVAQSSSLATNVMFVLGVVLVALLKRRRQANDSSSSVTPELKDDNAAPQNVGVGNYSIVSNSSQEARDRAERV